MLRFTLSIIRLLSKKLNRVNYLSKLIRGKYARKMLLFFTKTQRFTAFFCSIDEIFEKENVSDLNRNYNSLLRLTACELNDICNGIVGSRSKQVMVLPPVIIQTNIDSFSRDALTDTHVREAPTAWNTASYLSVSPMIFAFRDAIVHSSAGIISIADRFLTPTVWHTDPNRHRYQISEDGIELMIKENQYLSGTHISLLAGSCDNYYHFMIDSVARLSTLTEAQIDNATSILIPENSCNLTEVISLYPLPSSLRIKQVSLDETFVVDKLLYPSTLNGLCCYHPSIMNFFDTVSGQLPIDNKRRPKRVYVDRRRSSSRELLNEAEIVSVLKIYDFVPVCLEDISLKEQIYLFREAESIIAPHGAGLTNIVFCNKECKIIEFIIDAYLHGGFRRLAAVRGLSYNFRLVEPRSPGRLSD